MKAVRYHGQGDLRLEDVPAPELRPGAVRLRPAFTGICGSDLHLYFDGPMPPAPGPLDPHPVSAECLPVGFGHEFSAVVTELGPGVCDLAVGDRVVVEPLLVCDRCPACLAGQYNCCRTLGFVGISGGGGGLSEQVVVDTRWVHPVGDLPLDQAALIEPLAVALHAVRTCGVRPGQVAAVGGAGPVGLLAAAVLKAYGLRVVISEPSAVRRRTALQTGVADVVVDPLHQELEEVVRAETDGRGADVAFDAAGVPAVLQALLSLLRPTGRLQVIALHLAPVPLDVTGSLIVGEKSVAGALAYCNDHAEAIDLARSGRVDLASFITRRLSVDRLVEDGLRPLHEDGESEVKVLVHLPEPSPHPDDEGTPS